MEGVTVSGGGIVCLMLGALYLAQGRGWSKWRAKIEPHMIIPDDIMTACEMSLMAFEAARNDREHREPVGLFFRKCGSTQGHLWCEYLQCAGSSVVKIFFARARRMFGIGVARSKRFSTQQNRESRAGGGIFFQVATHATPES